MRSVLFFGLMLSGAGPTAAPGGDIPQLDPGTVGAGRAVYNQYCASCHGPNGEGAQEWQKQNERGELPAPAHDATGHTWRHADGELYEMISKGWRDPFNRTDVLTMPAFEGTLSPQEIAAAITYLKTLWSPDQRQFQSEENQARPLPPEAE